MDKEELLDRLYGILSYYEDKHTADGTLTKEIEKDLQAGQTVASFFEDKFDENDEFYDTPELGYDVEDNFDEE